MTDTHFLFWAAAPALTFAVLTLLEAWRPRPGCAWSRDDWILNGSGLLIQGTVIPLASLAIGDSLGQWMQPIDGMLPGSTLAFLTSFCLLDLLYYWQHRWFHGQGWPVHRAHHGARRLAAWACARNSLLAHPLFVYLVPSALLALVCHDKAAFFAGAMLTASLDLWRHSSIRWPATLATANRLLAWVLITPQAHHWHHQEGAPRCNFGANLSLWDRLFGTYFAADDYPQHYGIDCRQDALEQLLAPCRLTWRS